VPARAGDSTNFRVDMLSVPVLIFNVADEAEIVLALERVPVFQPILHLRLQRVIKIISAHIRAENLIQGFGCAIFDVRYPEVSWAASAGSRPCATRSLAGIVDRNS